MLFVPSRQLLVLRTRSPRQTDGADAGMHAMNRAGETSIVYAGRCALTSSHALGAFTDCRAQHKRLGTEWRSALIEQSEEVLPNKRCAPLAWRSSESTASSRGNVSGKVAKENQQETWLRRGQRKLRYSQVLTPGLGSMYSHKSTTRLVALRRSLTRPGESAKAPSTRSQWQQQPRRLTLREQPLTLRCPGPPAGHGGQRGPAGSSVGPGGLRGTLIPRRPDSSLARSLSPATAP
jgi:hypothetical protein